ncbi:MULTISPECIES: hypothetical protein [Rhodococcus]|uniref:hypothetical protein n=1 Tax=Rhodococcus TaxID=1827 RepID=UPI0006424219|nr:MULTISPECIES: hypothetical protein [Rhodococcus]KLN71629.1 hypothetical protein ABM90_10740 [Rhodococcus erythropolis]NHP18393.1 hypothetical protein [Rhodococcus sp. IC4_135]KSU66291.1 hypothetical protein AS032_32260 [Rhodococcus qingshengii]MYV31379.1 hypothetical protein [Rhodococcus erythropolis]OFE10519.1 hypothetical protein A5N83_02135 [Rhodococcus sp. 1139]
MQQGAQVRIGAEGVSPFTIVSVDEDTHTAIIESTADAPGKYPFPAKLATLVPVVGLAPGHPDEHDA